MKKPPLPLLNAKSTSPEWVTEAQRRLEEKFSKDFEVPFADLAKDPVTFIQDVLGVQLTPEQRQLAESVRDNSETNVPAAHGLGKCVAWSDLIPLSDGSEVKAGDLIGKEFELLSLEDGKVVPKKAIAQFNALEPVYRIQTETGKTITRSSNHPLFSATKWSASGKPPLIESHGWKHVSAIAQAGSAEEKEGRRVIHLVAMPSELPVFGESPLPDCEVKLMAYLIGDGGLTNKTPMFSQEDNAQLAEVKELAEEMGCTVRHASNYDYRLKQRDEDRYTSFKKTRTTFLKDRGDFSCAEHTCVRGIIKSSELKAPAFYGRLKFLGIQPVKFYGRSYISKSQLELYQAFDKGFETVKAKDGKTFVSMKEAAAHLSDHQLAMAKIFPSTERLEAQLLEAKSLLREEQGIGLKHGHKTNPITAMLESHGLMGKTSHHKFIPEAIFKLPKEQCATFLSRLYSTDGWASCSKNKGNTCQIEIGLCSVSRRLIDEVQRLLLRFGIRSSVYHKKKVNAWSLSIREASQIILFAEQVGIYGKEKAIATAKELATQRLGSGKVSDWRSREAPEGCHWERVVEVECIGVDYTVAIEVPGINTFLTTFYEHNTKVASCIAIWWAFAVGGLFISTAPTKRQVNELLWGEIRKTYDQYRNVLGGERGQTFLRLTEEARGYGFTSRSSGDLGSSGFQGIHANKLLILMDEANGVSDDIDAAAAACVTGSQNRILRIGNPTAPGTSFEASCAESSIRLPVWNHPNVAWAYERIEIGENKWIHRLTDDAAAKILDEQGRVTPQELWPEDCPRDIIPGAVSIVWIEGVRRKYGEGSAYWLGRVEAIFPQSSGNSLIPRDWFDAARARYDANPAKWDARARSQKYRHGLDVGDGGDPHAMATWKGPVLYSVTEVPTAGDRLDVSRGADAGWKLLCEKGGVIAVDQIGVGAGALSEMRRRTNDPSRRRENRHNGTVIGCKYNARPTGAAAEIAADDSPYNESNDEDFVLRNLKADYCMALREAFRLEEVAIAPLGDEMEAKIAKGFSLIFYEETSTGYIQIEKKNKTKARLRRSPDPEDAVVMAFSAKPEEESFASYW